MPDADPMAVLTDAVDLHNEWPTEVTTARVVEAADALVRAQRDHAAYVELLRRQPVDPAQVRRLMGLPVVAVPVEPLTSAMKGVVMVPAMDDPTAEACGRAFDKALDETFDAVRKTIVASTTVPCPSGCGVMVAPGYPHQGCSVAWPEHTAMCARLDNEPGPCDCGPHTRGCCASRIDSYHAADCQAPGVVREGDTTPPWRPGP